MLGRALLSLVGVAALAAAAFATQTASSVPKPLLSKLTRGVNVTRWFCYLKDPKDTKHYQNYLTAKDLQTFKRLKLGFIRLCVSPEAIYRDGSPDATNLQQIDRALALLRKAGLAVIWDLHDNGQMRLDAPGSPNDAGFVSFWQALARHYQGKDLNNVVFELVNEPIYNSNPRAWHALQDRTLAAVRAIDPKRTILVTGPSWGGIEPLIAMGPLPYKNLIYSYHCYDPFTFTHQGAGWTGDFPAKVKNVPFPSSPSGVEAILGENDAKYRAGLVSYGASRFDAAYLRARLSKAEAWGKQHGVPTLLGEFGAYPPAAPPASRGRWFEGMRQAIEALGVRDALWGYDDALGLGRRLNADGSLWLDPVTLRSLYGIG